MRSLCPVCSTVLLVTETETRCPKCRPLLSAVTLDLPPESATATGPAVTLDLPPEPITATVPAVTLDLPDTSVPSAPPDATLDLPSERTAEGRSSGTPDRSSSTHPERIGRFEIRAFLGEGAFGRVYRAFDPVLDRDVALKTMKRAALVQTEARAAAHLRHPNIVPIHEVNADGEEPYIASGFITGQTLARDLLDREQRPYPEAEAVALVRKLAEALAYAHGRGVVHRDVKPGNVMVENGEPVLLDFGLASRESSGDGRRAGTPAYMAPEQWDGKAEPASDRYALGCILYELLTGQTPFAAANVEHFAFLHCNQPAPRVRQKNPAVSRDLEAIVAKCLAKEPSGRYADCQALAEDLRRYQAGEPVAARPPGPLERAAKWVRRNPVVSALTAAVLLVLTAGVVVSWVFASEAARQAQDALDFAKKADDNAKEANENAKRADAKTKEANENAAKAKDAADRAEREKTQAENNLRKAEWSVYAGKLLLAQAAFNENNVPDAFRHLEECQWDLRGWEHAHLRWRFDESKQTFRGHKSSVTSVSFSPDGKRILTGSEDTTAKVWDAEKGTEVLNFKGHKSSVTSVSFSPDGKRILTGSEDRTARVWDAESGQEKLTLKGHKSSVTSVSFSPDGKRILTRSGGFDTLGNPLPGDAKVWDAEKGTELLTLKGHKSSVTSVSFSPDGKRILTGSMDTTAKVWDAEKGTELLNLKGNNAPVTSVSFSLDGKRILTGSADKTAKVWDAEKGTELLNLKGHTREVSSVSFSPDGKRAFAWDISGKVLAWDTTSGQPVAADDPPAKPALGLAILGLAISPDGRLSAEPDGTTVRLIDLLKPPPPAGSPWPLPDRAERMAYHTAQAEAAEKAGQWFAAAFHVERLLVDRPWDAPLRLRLARLYAQHQLPERAVRHYLEAILLDPQVTPGVPSP